MTDTIIKILCFLFVSVQLGNTQISIAEARTKSLNTKVSIEGIITTGEETGSIRFIQDNTAGIALYPGSSDLLDDIAEGDKIQITGTLTQFKGLLELKDLEGLKKLSSNNTLPEAKEIAIKDLGSKYESELVAISCADINGSGNFKSGSYILTQDNSEQGNAYVPSDSELVGTPIPTTNKKFIGISSVYNEPQILLLKKENIIDQPCFYFTYLPIIESIKKNELTMVFSTNEEANAQVFFSEYDQNISEYKTIKNQSKFELTFSDLKPGTIYKGYVSAKKSSDETIITTSPLLVMATQSESSGEIKVYFNNSVDESFSNGSYANGDSNGKLLGAVISAIKNAEQTIDIAMYNNNNTSITNELKAAVDRGVVVRYITEFDNNNYALSNVNFEVLEDNTSGLMHNKFLIIDRDKVNAKVITGSTNFTNNQIYTDPNNLIIIEDQSMARGYTIEFEEMWGSKNAQPNKENSKFGSNKTDNTPHVYNINGVALESYFSPSDQVTSQIEKVISESTTSINSGLLTFTNNTLGSAMVNQAKNGVKCRVIIENHEDIGSEFDYLKNNLVEVANHLSEPILHHKYAIIDEGETHPIVVTGSHNWTVKAEYENDENTIIIHDKDVTNIFRQEFEKRWSQVVDIKNTSMADIRLYPNPTTQYIKLENISKLESYMIYSIDGKLIKQGEISENPISISGLKSGLYILQLRGKGGNYQLGFSKM